MLYEKVNNNRVNLGTCQYSTLVTGKTLYTNNRALKIMVIGASRADSMAAIRLAFGDLDYINSKHKGDNNAYQTNLVVDDLIYDLELIEWDTNNVIKAQSSQIHNDYIQFDGVIVCYDINHRDSLDSLIDLSRTSSTSSDPGYTVADIVNELTLWDYHDQDTGTMIFLAFYRKFMTPYQLLQSLIEKFEQDYNSENQPTRCQERIRTILGLWLSHQWGDFYYGRSYHTLNRFLQRLGNCHGLSAMYRLLSPLITRPGPLSDPDTMWGLTDDEADDNSNSSFYSLWMNSPSITTMRSMSSSIGSINDDNSDRHLSLSSEASFGWYQEATTPTPLKINTHHLSRNSSNSRPTLSTTSSSSSSDYSQDTTLDSHESKEETNTNTRQTDSAKRTSRRQVDDPAVFGGGLMLLETTGRRPFSLEKLQSSLRHKSHNRHAMLMNIPVVLLAEQLTWAELVLYRNIKPRDYIRHLWGEKGASEAMMASISHGNFIKEWVVTMILIQSNQDERVALLNKFVDLSYRLYQDHRNYNTLASVLEGLNQVLDCLQHTQLTDMMDQAKKKQLQELVTLMQRDRNYALYRQDLVDFDDGYSIPYLQVHRQDIVTIAKTQRDVTIGGGVHWEKFKSMGEIILQLTQAGALATTTQPNPHVLAFLSDTSLLTEKERICRLDDLREK
ncbi:ras guanine nucleotide exchange factor domain-containing protein [Chlamydoabsidia padenii]|nr:ras guanine nucleotide exchange factor domain-containing protein [Chlamydoabsidia padenii]